MKALTAILLATLAAAAHAQQAAVQYSWTWSEVLAHSNTPSSATPGVIDPTEGVRLTMHVLMVPGIGGTVQYIPPPGPGVGTVWAFGGNVTELVGNSSALGRFELLSVAPGFDPAFTLNTFGTNASFGATSQAWQSLQNANFSNPINGLLSLTWTPNSYEPREVSFFSRDVVTAQGSNPVFIQYGTGPTGTPLLAPGIAFANHGSGTGAIRIVPAPAGLAAVAAAVFAARRNRAAKPHGRCTA